MEESGNRRRWTGTSGQAMVFLLVLLVILVFMVLWNFDLHKIISVKTQSQNAGDSAAVAAARWQAISLNLIGDLNIAQAVAISESFSGGGGAGQASPAISELQARICFAGPMVALLASQEAGKMNHMFNNGDYTAYLRAHAGKIRNDYPFFIAEPYQGCLDEYANMLDAICDNGIAVGPDSMVLYTDYLGDHFLLNKDFYDAVATRAWCWFYFNAFDLLNNYTSYLDWPPLPAIVNPMPVNCEFFSLHMRRMFAAISDEDTVDAINELKDERGLGGAYVLARRLGRVAACWYCYDESWYSQFPMSDPSFPAASPVKPQYDYLGADAAVRTEVSPDTRSPGSRRQNVTWTAAAKPFGYLQDDSKPTDLGIVLPAFREAALIPVDCSSSPLGGSFDLAFRNHAENHLPPYLAAGTNSLPWSCWYCAQIRTWDDPVFRNQGLVWLSSNSALCTVGGPGGGGGGGGGSRRGH